MSRLIDADVFVKNVVKYSHQSTKTIGQALADTPTIKAVPIDVLRDIRAEIVEQCNDICAEKHGCIDEVLTVIDKHLKGYEE